jgi:MSHA biogenesis protein MshN
MSLINKMLQELDRRNAMGAGAADPAVQHLKPVEPRRPGHEWFWRVMAVLVLIALFWVGWVAYQLQPRTLVIEQALRPVEPPPAVPTAAPAPQPAPAPSAPVESAETFKLARSIETPIAEPKPKPKPEAKKPAPAAAVTAVDKRDRGKPVNEAAEAQFRRAAALLNQGRVSEAEDQLRGALQSDPSHGPARQAYVALLLEQRRMDAALATLREAVALHPGQPTFSLALARVHAEKRDYRAALDVMEKAGSVAQSVEFLAFRGAVLQRLGRHAEAVSAYQIALQSAPRSGATWMGLGISLEALGRHAEAAQAYQHALGAGPLASEVRDYAQARIRALQ